MPTRIHDPVDERRPRVYLTRTGIHTEQGPTRPLKRRLLTAPAFVRSRRSECNRRHHPRVRRRPSHSRRGPPAGFEHQQPVQRLLLRFRLHGAKQAEDPGVVRVDVPGRRGLTNSARPVTWEMSSPRSAVSTASAGDMWSTSQGLAVNYTRWVTSWRHTQSRKSWGAGEVDARRRCDVQVDQQQNRRPVAPRSRRTGRTGRGSRRDERQHRAGSPDPPHDDIAGSSVPPVITRMESEPPRITALRSTIRAGAPVRRGSDR